jgi:small-conductance mechanosensitive channel
LSNEHKKDNDLNKNHFNNNFQEYNNKLNYKLYQLLILVFIISCIPLINISNKIIVGLILSSVIIYFNAKLLEDNSSNIRIFIYCNFSILCYQPYFKHF